VVGGLARLVEKGGNGIVTLDRQLMQERSPFSHALSWIVWAIAVDGRGHAAPKHQGIVLVQECIAPTLPFLSPPPPPLSPPQLPEGEALDVARLEAMREEIVDQYDRKGVWVLSTEFQVKLATWAITTRCLRGRMWARLVPLGLLCATHNPPARAVATSAARTQGDL